MIFKQNTRAALQDWITPPQVEIVKVATQRRSGLSGWRSAPRSSKKQWGRVIYATKKIVYAGWMVGPTDRTNRVGRI